MTKIAPTTDGQIRLNESNNVGITVTDNYEKK